MTSPSDRIMATLRSAVECRDCQAVKLMKMYECEYGHLICENCKTWRESSGDIPLSCPVAECGFPDPPRRNVAIERVIRILDSDKAKKNQSSSAEGAKAVKQPRRKDWGWEDVPLDLGNPPWYLLSTAKECGCTKEKPCGNHKARD